jgi:hypothetical protein
MKFKKLFLLELVLLASLNIFSQKIIVHGQESSGKLTWSDFTGKVDRSSSFNAYTSYKFNTKIGNIKFVGDSAIINGFEVILELDQKNSWAKKDKVTDELLVHEQGHFNFGILCVKEIMTKYNQAKFTKANYNSILQGIINDASKKYNEMGLRYDEETDHSKQKEQQAKWNAFFSENLTFN